MKLGLNISNFTFGNGPSNLGSTLERIARTADEAGFDRLSVLDHVFQFPPFGSPENEMLEAYTTLGFLAAHTNKVKLMALVTAAVYREPGLLAKMATTLDVLSSGRAILGIGAAWYEEEATGLGLSMPPIAERFERLEETLQICLQMWDETDLPYEGTHYRLGRTLNSPQSITRPHPPIVIGGAGERKTLRLVAQYAQACNLPMNVDHKQKLAVLRMHCEQIGRNFDEIEKTALFRFNVGQNAENVPKILEDLRALSGLGIDVAHGGVVDVANIRPLEVIGERIIPEISSW